MSSQTAKEVKQKYINSMGEPLGSIFYALWNEVAWLYHKWNEYLELYGNKPSRVELMNRATPLFFRMLQDVMWEDILLHVARLTDSSKSTGKSNLSIKQLESVENACDLIKKAEQSAEFCRDWRNRRIAHRDLQLAIEKDAEPLKLAGRTQVKAALSAIAKVMNAVEQQYTNSTTVFDLGIGRSGAKELLYVLDDGLKAKNERLSRLKGGESHSKDFEPRNL